jgi:hypothetical protein
VISGAFRRAVFATIALLWVAVPEVRADQYSDAMRYGSACGVNRWAVKTLADPGAAHLPATARSTTVAAMTRIPPPAGANDLGDRVPPVETTLWHVRALLQGYVLEEDSDIHLLLLDPQTRAPMIAEIPASYCAPKVYAARFDAARQAVQNLGHHAARLHRIWWLDYHGGAMPLVDVWGYGFWDYEHGQRGVAPNDVELHPVMRVAPAT